MNKNIVITGGSSGIGLSLSKKFIEQGHNVFIISRSTLKANIDSQNCFKIDCDITKIESIELARNKVSEILEGYENKNIDCLISCAGVGYEKPLEKIDESDFNYMFNTNVKGLIFATKIFLPLITKPNSIICNISSIAGIKGFAGWTLYSSSKFAVEGFTESLRHELRPKRIKVMGVRLGSVNTPFYKDLSSKEKLEFINPDEVASILLNSIFIENNTVVENIFINNTVGDL
jgi:short-subunit dehydrogenase